MALSLAGNSRFGKLRKNKPKPNKTQTCKVESERKQEGDKVKVLGFSQAGMLSQAWAHRVGWQFDSLV